MFIENITEDFYNIIRGKNVLLFVNNDIDALCACKIFQNLFKCMSVLYTLVTVEGLEELADSYKNYSEQFKCVILVNCGGAVDIVEILQPDEEVKIFIVDSHKPSDVCNVYSRSQVRLIGKADENERIPDFDEIFRDTDEESDYEDYDVPEERLLKIRERRQWMEKRDHIMHEYTQFSFYGRASSMVVYELMWHLGKENIDCLWWAIVGLTYQMLYGLVEETKYNLELPTLQLHLARLTPMMTDLHKSDTLRITTQKDLKLVLYRHWTVQGSLRYSMTTATKFKSWNINGEKRIQRILAEMGLPLSESIQNFSSMDVTLRNGFTAMVESISEKYNLENMSYTCFVLSHGYRHCYQAADYVYALFGLMAACDVSTTSCKTRFLEALDCLSRSKYNLLNLGIDKAKKLLIMIYNDAQGIIDLNQVINAGPFLYFVYNEGSNSKTYASPLTLLTLARYVLHFYASSTKNKRTTLLPLIASASCSSEECIVLGIPPASELFPRNFFGKAFERSMDVVNTSAVTTYFDTAMVKIKKIDRPKFFDSLVTILG